MEIDVIMRLSLLNQLDWKLARWKLNSMVHWTVKMQVVPSKSVGLAGSENADKDDQNQVDMDFVEMQSSAQCLESWNQTVLFSRIQIGRQNTK